MHGCELCEFNSEREVCMEETLCVGTVGTLADGHGSISEDDGTGLQCII